MRNDSPAIVSMRLSLFLELLRRELRLRYLGTFSGSLWVFAQPLAQLAIYGYVFGTIFQARLPQAEFGQLGFITFLAVGLWPWLAFAESLTRANTAIIDNAGLLGKVAVPRVQLVAAPVVAGMALHLLGFMAVLTVLVAIGSLQPSTRWLALLPLYLSLAVFTLGMAWFTSALSVFVRDLTHVLAQILMLLFFLTPVLYPRSLIPPALLPIADFNPLALFISTFRTITLGVGEVSIGAVVGLGLLTLITAVLGWLAFRRLSPHFEDFL